MGTGTCVALIAAGAILRFAVATKQSHGINVHVVGVIVLLAGVLGLVLSLLVWGPLNPARRQARSSAGNVGLPPPVSYESAPPPVSYESAPPVAQQRPLYRDELPPR